MIHLEENYFNPAYKIKISLNKILKFSQDHDSSVNPLCRVHQISSLKEVLHRTSKYLHIYLVGLFLKIILFIPGYLCSEQALKFIQKEGRNDSAKKDLGKKRKSRGSIGPMSSGKVHIL